MNKYGQEVSEELKQTIADIKPLPENKIKEGFKALNYVFIGNIIYFGYQNKCYNLEQMEFLFLNLKGIHGCYNYKNYDDYVTLVNGFLDKLGLTEEYYQTHENEILTPYKIEVMENHIARLKRFNEILHEQYMPEQYNHHNRNKLAFIDYMADNYTPFEVLEGLTDNGFYHNGLVFEDNSDYRRLERYYEKEYEEEYWDASNIPDFVMKKMIEEVCPEFKDKFHYEAIRKDKSTVFIDIKKEETDIEDNIDYEDEIIIYSNNIAFITELAYKLSNYYCEVEMNFEREE